MRGFTYALAEGEARPERVILMNGGVRLAVEGSESLPNLRRLAEVGVDVMACGTCLDYYKLKDKLAVGRVTNMYEIAELLMAGNVLSP
jgi:intracellular sulfur oxidation DsrE/DsrF family protein